MRALNLPNILTLARILLIPVFAVLYIVPGFHFTGALVFGLAAFTDWLDGYLARKLDQTTPFGAFLDPVADKLIVVVAMALLIGHHGSYWVTVPGLIIISREVFISALREWMAEMNARVVVDVTSLGRVKTAMQMTSIGVLLAYSPDFGEWWLWSGYGLLFIAAGLTLVSMIIYLRAAWPSLMEGLE